MGDISKDLNTSFPNNKVKALLNIMDQNGPFLRSKKLKIVYKF